MLSRSQRLRRQINNPYKPALRMIVQDQIAAVALRGATGDGQSQAMDGRWRRPHTSMSGYGHAEHQRGTEWWGKSLLLTFGLSKVRRRKGATLSSRYSN